MNVEPGGTPDVGQNPEGSPQAAWWTQRGAWLAGTVLLIVFVILLITSSDEIGASDLALLPPASSLIVVANVEDVLNSELGASLRSVFSKQFLELEEEMANTAGFSPDDVSQIVIGGDVDARGPSMLIAFKGSVDDEQLEKIARAMRIETDARDVGGHQVFGREEDRMIVGRVRSSVLLIGPPGDVESALADAENRKPPKLAELLTGEVGLDASISVAFDWTNARSTQRSLRRSLEGLVPILVKHVGPVFAEAHIGSDAKITASLMNGARKTVARYEGTVDGAFLAELLADLSKAANEERRRRFR